MTVYAVCTNQESGVWTFFTIDKVSGKVSKRVDFQSMYPPDLQPLFEMMGIDLEVIE